jgi:hypothetical protein
LFLLALCLSGNASAVIPENGWWWNAAESGRGFNLEIQNDLLFFASFAYDANGNPVWLTAGGQMSDERNWSSTLYVTAHGQCFGCAYTAPVLTAAGSVSLFFTSSQTAVLTINGFSVNVSRFDFWQNSVIPNAMLGQWSAVIGAALDVFDGERINYFLTGIANDGTPYAGGSRLGSTTAQNPATVEYSNSQGQWTALLDSSTAYYRLFVFNTTGFNRVEGTFWIYQKGGSPTGSGTFYQAFRTASAARIQTGVGPGSSKSLAASGQAQADRDAALFAQLNGEDDASKVSNPAISEIARALEARLSLIRKGGTPLGAE